MDHSPACPGLCEDRLDGLQKATDELHLLRAMGSEVANVHLASGKGPEISEDLCRRDPRWLQDATDAALDAVGSDYKVWRDG
jgi:hypothetical protein